MNKILTLRNSFTLILIIWVIFIPFKNSLYQISSFLLICIFFIYMYRNRDFEYVKSLIYLYKDIIFSFLLIIGSMTISNSINDVANTEAWRLEFSYIYRYAFILFLLLYFYGKEVFSKKLLVLLILVSFGIQALDGLYQIFMGYDLFKHNMGDLTIGLTGVTFNRNIFGLIVGLGVLLSLFSIKNISYSDEKFSILFGLLIVFIFCTLFSYSRAVWVSLFVVIMIYFVVNLKKIKMIHLVYFLIILIILGLIFFNIDSLSNRLVQLLNGEPSHRDEIWLHSLTLVIQKPFFGWGLDSWRLHGLKNFSNVHNSILEVLVSMGILGFISFFIFIFLTLKEIIYIRSIRLFCILIFLLIVSQFDQSIISGKIFISIIVLLIFYIFSNRLKELNNKKGIK